MLQFDYLSFKILHKLWNVIESHKHGPAKLTISNIECADILFGYFPRLTTSSCWPSRWLTPRRCNFATPLAFQCFLLAQKCLHKALRWVISSCSFMWCGNLVSPFLPWKIQCIQSYITRVKMRFLGSQTKNNNNKISRTWSTCLHITARNMCFSFTVVILLNETI